MLPVLFIQAVAEAVAPIVRLASTSPTSHVLSLAPFSLSTALSAASYVLFLLLPLSAFSMTYEHLSRQLRLARQSAEPAPGERRYERASRRIARRSGKQANRLGSRLRDGQGRAASTQPSLKRARGGCWSCEITFSVRADLPHRTSGKSAGRNTG